MSPASFVPLEVFTQHNIYAGEMTESVPLEQ
jgi:hypothetical protein